MDSVAGTDFSIVDNYERRDWTLGNDCGNYAPPYLPPVDHYAAVIVLHSKEKDYLKDMIVQLDGDSRLSRAEVNRLQLMALEFLSKLNQDEESTNNAASSHL